MTVRRASLPVEALAGFGRPLWRGLQIFAAELAIDDHEIRRLLTFDDWFRMRLLRRLERGQLGLAAAVIRWRLR